MADRSQGDAIPFLGTRGIEDTLDGALKDFRLVTGASHF